MKKTVKTSRVADQLEKMYDYYNCPDDPDTGTPACGDLPECKSCSWYHLIQSAQKCQNT